MARICTVFPPARLQHISKHGSKVDLRLFLVWGIESALLMKWPWLTNWLFGTLEPNGTHCGFNLPETLFTTVSGAADC